MGDNRGLGAEMIQGIGFAVLLVSFSVSAAGETDALQTYLRIEFEKSEAGSPYTADARRKIAAVLFGEHVPRPKPKPPDEKSAEVKPPKKDYDKLPDRPLKSVGMGQDEIFIKNNPSLAPSAHVPQMGGPYRSFLPPSQPPPFPFIPPPPIAIPPGGGDRSDHGDYGSGMGGGEARAPSEEQGSVPQSPVQNQVILRALNFVHGTKKCPNAKSQREAMFAFLLRDYEHRYARLGKEGITGRQLAELEENFPDSSVDRAIEKAVVALKKTDHPNSQLLRRELNEAAMKVREGFDTDESKMSTLLNRLPSNVHKKALYFGVDFEKRAVLYADIPKAQLERSLVELEAFLKDVDCESDNQTLFRKISEELKATPWTAENRVGVLETIFALRSLVDDSPPGIMKPLHERSRGIMK